VRLQTTSGQVRFKLLDKRVIKLVRYTNTNRVPPADLDNCQNASVVIPCGGDAWALPSVKTLAETLQAPELKWGDFSNMNGGLFPPHNGHRLGDTADGEFSGYKHRDAAAAETLLALVNSQATRITRVLVAFNRINGDRFWETIRGVRLSDGRCARAVILPDANHKGHFDIRFEPPHQPVAPQNSCWP
jgi:hypothetical protein